MTTYFGKQTGDDFDDYTGSGDYMTWINADFTAPESGNLSELSIYGKLRSGIIGIRIGLWLSSNAYLVAESDFISVVNGDYAWIGGIGADQLRPYGGNYGDAISITKDTNYVIGCISVGSGDFGVRGELVASGQAVIVTGRDYSTGYPQILPYDYGNPYDVQWLMRAGIGGGGGSPIGQTSPLPGFFRP